MRKMLGYFIIFVGIILLLYVIYLNSRAGQTTRTFSTYSLITSSWEKYKDQFINEDGRVIDFEANDSTTSEGQSYALLRAVWVDDRPTFDHVWTFTKNALRRPDDNLFGWRWGKIGEDQYGFASDDDRNSSTDADVDIGLALILAGRRWETAEYTEEAKKILSDIWEKETAEANGKRYVIAGNWAQNENFLTLNPSYFAPYAYRIFAQVDIERPWNDLIDPGYELLQQSGTEPLNTEKAVGLPPDWVVIDRQTGALSAPPESNLTTHYSYDAIRTPWRVALDYQWNKEQKAMDYLLNSYSVLIEEYKTKNKLAATYQHDGTVLEVQEGPAMYATAIGFLLYADKALADKAYEEKILRLYSNNTNSFNEELPYYDQNWLWFGIALYNNYLVPFN